VHQKKFCEALGGVGAPVAGVAAVHQVGAPQHIRGVVHARGHPEWASGAGGASSAGALAAERYRGIRPAFGYPACPDHQPKARLFDLLDAPAIGMSLSESLAMLPAVLGILTTSIISGRLITKTGRYKIFPIIGAAVLVVSLLMMSRLRVDTPFWQLAVYQLAFGAGLGLGANVRIALALPLAPLAMTDDA